MPTTHARNVVLGAGAVGAAAAYHLAKRGEPVLLVEQFSVGHDRGSSHGSARIARHSYSDASFAKLMPEAFRAWAELEADAGEPLFLRTGGVSISPDGVDYVEKVAANLQAFGVPHRRMSGAALNRSVPVFKVADDADVVFEPDAGILSAARALRAEIRLAKELGGDATTILENIRVQSIDTEADRPTLVTDAGTITADRLIITAGPWTARLLPSFPVPLRPTRQQVLYLTPPDPTAYAPGRLPVFIYKGQEDLDAFYGMPAFDGLGVKAARHGGLDVDPDHHDPEVGESYRAVVRRFLASVFPALAEAPVERTEVCIYTVAPDDRFHVGPFAGRPDVLVASPCSGHGFKFSCLIGRVLADLAGSGESSVDINDWNIAPSDTPA